MLELWSAREPFGSLSHLGLTTLTSTSKAEKVWSTSINIFQNFSNSSSQTEGGFHSWSDICYNFGSVCMQGQTQEREGRGKGSLARPLSCFPSLSPTLYLGVASCAVKCNPPSFFSASFPWAPNPPSFSHLQDVIAGERLKLPHGVQERLWPAIVVSQMDGWSPPVVMLH